MSNRKSSSNGRSIVDEFIKAANAKIAETGINMSELARRAGVARPYLYRVLNGEQTPSFATAEKIAKELGLTFKILEKSA